MVLELADDHPHKRFINRVECLIIECLINPMFSHHRKG